MSMTLCKAISPMIKINTFSKTFRNGSRIFKAVDSVNLNIQPGEMVALIGASGSGKSTLLRNLAGLIAGDRNKGGVEVLGMTVQKNGVLAKDIRKIRARIGFIFQQFNLVNRLSVLNNVLAGTLCRVPVWRSTILRFTDSEKRMAIEALDRVGIAEFAMQRASTLSGGQQQRAAIARALVQKAEVVLADEPIASLDPVSARNVMEILSQINEDGITVVVTLHQVNYAFKYCRRVVALKDGRVVYDGGCNNLTPEMLRDIYGDQFIESGFMEEETVATGKNGSNQREVTYSS